MAWPGAEGSDTAADGVRSKSVGFPISTVLDLAEAFDQKPILANPGYVAESLTRHRAVARSIATEPRLEPESSHEIAHEHLGSNNR